VTRAGPPVQHSERGVIGYLAFLSVVMAFGVHTALPAFDEIRGAFDLDQTDSSVSLVVTTYLLGLGLGQLAYGVVSDRFGRGPVLRGGLLIYAVGALGSTLSPSLVVLLVSRFVWGLGAAAPGGLRPAIARDLYSGDRMARVMSVMMAVFLMAPIVGPIVGELLVELGGWRAAMAGPGLLVVIALIWSFRFGETLPPEQRRPLQLHPIGLAVREIVKSRVTIGYTLMLTILSGAFFSFLGSSQPIIDNVYDRPGDFSLFFGVNGAVMGTALWISSRAIARVGMMRMMSVCMATFLAAAILQFVVTSIGDGRPDPWFWLATISTMNAATMVISASAMSVALEPMRHIAGTAASVVGAVSMLGSALIGWLIDSRIDTTVTPLAIGYLACGVSGAALMIWARGGRVASVADQLPEPAGAGHRHRAG
jgi:DHA1 family bicyclomycin/chloramphenicol resistance-like MFS transporter